MSFIPLTGRVRPFIISKHATLAPNVRYFGADRGKSLLLDSGLRSGPIGIGEQTDMVNVVQRAGAFGPVRYSRKLVLCGH
jgi:hypothetical protein